MQKIGIFYGSSTGNTEFVAQKIQQALGMKNADIIDVAGNEHTKIAQYKNIILGTSTWGLGDLQDDFDIFFSAIENIDFKGKVIALFGLGDQIIYEMSFINALGIIHENLKKKECTFTGKWPVEGYFFKKSSAVISNQFVGLAIDEENQSELTDERVKNWVEIIKKDFI